LGGRERENEGAWVKPRRKRRKVQVNLQKEVCNREANLILHRVGAGLALLHQGEDKLKEVLVRAAETSKEH